MNPQDTATQRTYLDRFTALVEADERVRAAWVEGSFGRGNADRYSDLDLHLLLREDDLPAFRDEIEVLLSKIQPLVLCTLLFDGKMVNALTDQGLRLDIWLHTGDPAVVNRHNATVLLDKGNNISYEESTQSINTSIQTLPQQIEEFWRCIALLPSVLGRDEFIVGVAGLNVETSILTTVLLTGYGIQRDRGVKNLNQFLPAIARAEIEAALVLPELSRISLATAHLELARLMQHYGRLFADQHGFGYPIDLEAAVLRYVHTELSLLGVSTTQKE